jgi:hypothetical protein
MLAVINVAIEVSSMHDMDREHHFASRVPTMGSNMQGTIEGGNLIP